jgi:hypothetical protein
VTSRIDPDLGAAAFGSAPLLSARSIMDACERAVRAHASNCRCCRDVSNRRRPDGVAFFAL